MKNSVKAILATATLLASAASVQAAGVTKEARFVGDVAFANFCKAVVLDDVRILRASLSRQVGRIGVSQKHVLKMVTAENGLTCNGETLVDFSKQRDAKAVHSFLTSYNR